MLSETYLLVKRKIAVKIKVRHPQEIENVLWAAQTVSQAFTILSSEARYSTDYYRGWEKSFQETIVHVARSFDRKAASIKIWRRRDIQQFLLWERASLPYEAGNSAPFRRGAERGCEAAFWCCATLFGIDLFPLKPDGSSVPTNQVFSQEWLVGTDIKNMLAALHTTAAELSAMAQDYPAATAFYRGFEVGIRQVENCFRINSESSSHKSTVKTASVPLWMRGDIKAKLKSLYTKPFIEQNSRQIEPFSSDIQKGYQAALQAVAKLLGFDKLA